MGKRQILHSDSDPSPDSRQGDQRKDSSDEEPPARRGPKRETAKHAYKVYQDLIPKSRRKTSDQTNPKKATKTGAPKLRPVAKTTPSQPKCPPPDISLNTSEDEDNIPRTQKSSLSSTKKLKSRASEKLETSQRLPSLPKSNKTKAIEADKRAGKGKMKAVDSDSESGTEEAADDLLTSSESSSESSGLEDLEKKDPSAVEAKIAKERVSWVKDDEVDDTHGDDAVTFDDLFSLGHFSRASPAPSVAYSPVHSLTGTPIHSPTIRSPIFSPVRSPILSPIRSPILSPVRSPIQSPILSPVPSPIRSRIPLPVHSPVRSPVRSPVHSPVRSPAFSPPHAPHRPASSRSPAPKHGPEKRRWDSSSEEDMESSLKERERQEREQRKRGEKARREKEERARQKEERAKEERAKEEREREQLKRKREKELKEKERMEREAKEHERQKQKRQEDKVRKQKHGSERKDKALDSDEFEGQSDGNDGNAPRKSKQKRKHQDEEISWVKGSNEHKELSRSRKHRDVDDVESDLASDCDDDDECIDIVCGNGPRPNLGDQHPRVYRVAIRAIKEVETLIATVNAFPEGEADGREYLRSILVKHATALKYKEMAKRLRDNKGKKYWRKFASIPAQRVSLLRGKVKKLCEGVVRGIYGLTVGDAAKVAWLLKGIAYTYPHDYKKQSVIRTEAFGLPIFVDMLQVAFFSKRTSYRHRMSHLFTSSLPDKPDEKEIPAAMLALVSTAIYASIDDFKFNRYETQKFEANTFIQAYRKNMQNLSEIKTRNPAAYHRLMHGFYTHVAGVSDGSSEAIDAMDYLDAADVVDYRQTRFLPEMATYDCNARQWDKDGQEIPILDDDPRPREQRVRWVHKSEKAVPRKKGDGVSLMVADFVSAEYGWLRSPDGAESARVIFRPGVNRDGYFTHEDVLVHATTAMDILSRHYPNECHIFIFDNVPTHLKRAADALSARHMSKFPTVPANPMFGVETTVLGDDSKPIYGPNGKPLKTKVRMQNATFADGTPQSLYFEDGPRAGVFKGMATLLEERGFTDAWKLRYECPSFKCAPPALNCCCRRLLFNQPDFRDVESLLETHCKTRGFPILFLPKFHCELNFIEQCWGYAKRVYRQAPPSSLEADLERNALEALEAVPLVSIRRFYTRSHRFMDAYRRGLTGKQAAWAAKKYHSHRVLPNDILAELDREGITPT
ncbi:hypothetical protein LXA43DRAFT_1105349 [Ganoderma leucocontextum]|nr:hypothetical protein LXA43DRAFT_1105349 [Ganoderma leucocontextum]